MLAVSRNGMLQVQGHDGRHVYAGVCCACAASTSGRAATAACAMPVTTSCPSLNTSPRCARAAAEGCTGVLQLGRSAFPLYDTEHHVDYLMPHISAILYGNPGAVCLITQCSRIIWGGLSRSWCSLSFLIM